jgi:hypothetical protein
MFEAAIRIHHTEQAFQRGLLKNERPCETPNHSSYDYDSVHFLILLPGSRAIGVPFFGAVLAPRRRSRATGNLKRECRS